MFVFLFNYLDVFQIKNINLYLHMFLSFIFFSKLKFCLFDLNLFNTKNKKKFFETNKFEQSYIAKQQKNKKIINIT